MAKKKPRPAQPTLDQRQERVDFVRELVSRRTRPSVIKQKFREEFGPADHRTVLGYVARAREAILADVARGRDELRGESQAFYQSVLADPLASYRDKIKAQERLDKLLGLERPQQIELDVTGPIEVDEYVITGTDRGEARGLPDAGTKKVP